MISIPGLIGIACVSLQATNHSSLPVEVLDQREQSKNRTEEILSVDFLAFRAGIESADHDHLVEISRDDLAIAISQAPIPKQGQTSRNWLSSYDGLVWGTRTSDTFASLWIERDNTESQDDFEYFDLEKVSRALIQFPRGTRLLGQTPRFVWDGRTNSVLNLYLPEHRSEMPHVWTNLQVGYRFFRFSIDPKAAFLELFPEFDQSQLVESIEHNQDENRELRTLTYRPDDRSVHSLRLEYNTTNGQIMLRRWRLVRTGLASEQSLIIGARVRVTPHQDGANEVVFRPLPDHPPDLLKTYDNVDGLNNVGIRDRTGLAKWPRRGVMYLTDQPQSDRETPGDATARTMFALTNILLFIITISLFRGWSRQPSSR